MGAVSGVDRTQRRFSVLGFPLAVIYKFFDDQGNVLAAAVTYYAFVAIFPLLLLASSILGFLLQGNPDLQAQVLDSALRTFPIVGDELGRPQGLQGSTSAIVVGGLAALYGAIGLGQALQNLMAVAWAVPRNSRPNPVLARVRSLVLLVFAGIGVVGISVFSAVGRNTEVFGSRLNSTVGWLVQLATVVVVGGVLTILFRVASARSAGVRTAIPGALTVAVLWQLLQYLGTVYVTNVLTGASSLNQTFAFVLGLVGLIYIASVMAILGIEVNVVLARRLWPRALLTPFTDAVDLTEADRRAYAMYAQMQRHKGFETVVVRFDGRDGDTHEIVLEPDRKEADLRGSVDPAPDPGPPPTAPIVDHPGEVRHPSDLDEVPDERPDERPDEHPAEPRESPQDLRAARLRE